MNLLLIVGLPLMGTLLFLFRSRIFNLLNHIIFQIAPLTIWEKRLKKWVYCLVHLKEIIKSYRNARKTEALKILFSIIRDKIFIFCGGHISQLQIIRTRTRKLYFLDYYYNQTRYRVLWPTRIALAHLVTAATNEEGYDILEIIKPCMGPDGMFHGSFLTPELLGFSEIVFETIHGERKRFKGSQTILLGQ